jgi:hypothetical protein
MADFTVWDGDLSMPYSGEAARYEVNPDSGVLTVFDGNGNRKLFSPIGWRSVTERVEKPFPKDQPFKEA